MSAEMVNIAKAIEDAKRLQLHSAVSVPEHAAMIGTLASLLESLSARVTQAERGTDEYAGDVAIAEYLEKSGARGVEIDLAYGAVLAYRRGSGDPDLLKPRPAPLSPGTGNEKEGEI